MTSEDDDHGIEELAEKVINKGSAQLDTGRYLRECSCNKNNCGNNCIEVCLFSVSPHPEKSKSVLNCTGPVFEIENREEELAVRKKKDSVREDCPYSPHRF
jgi:hypothetical protein